MIDKRGVMIILLGILINFPFISANVRGEVKEFSLEAFNFGFEPGIIKVNKGDKVRLKIKSREGIHGFGLYAPNLYNINKKLKLGKEVIVELVANQTGEFIFYCSNFCGRGHDKMVGKLIVQGERERKEVKKKVEGKEREVKIIIQNSKFYPSKISLTQGKKVKIRVINKDKVAHGFGSISLNLQTRIKPGEEKILELTPEKLGTFPFYCVVDCGENHFSMNGEIIVTENSELIKEEKESLPEFSLEGKRKFQFNSLIALMTLLGGFVLSAGGIFCYALYSKYSQLKKAR